MADGSDSDARTLFFYKLTSTIEADTLQTLTGQFGPIERCHVVTDEITQLPTGSALVTYTQQQDAVAAKSYLHGKWFCGEYLRVAFPGEQPAPVAAEPPPALMMPAIDGMAGQQYMAAAAGHHYAAAAAAAADPFGYAPQLAAAPFDYQPAMPYGYLPTRPPQSGGRAYGGKKIEDQDERQNREPHRALFLFYVTQEVTEQMLLEAFAPFGEILETTIPKKSDNSGEHKGYAFVTYRTVESAIEARNHLNGVKLGSKNIRITFQKQNFGANK